MTRRRLAEALSEETAGQQSAMRPGDVRTIHAKDPKTGEITKTFTLHRTDRPYAYDLRDAYNEAMTPDARQRGLEWYVADTGELKLGENAQWQRNHTSEMARNAERERQEWMRNNRRSHEQ